MEVQLANKQPIQFRFSVKNETTGKEMGRAFLIIAYNEIHSRPFGYLEDVFVSEDFRGQGVASRLIQAVVQKAQEENCYKLIAVCKPELIDLYNKFGLEMTIDKVIRHNFG